MLTDPLAQELIGAAPTFEEAMPTFGSEQYSEQVGSLMTEVDVALQGLTEQVTVQRRGTQSEITQAQQILDGARHELEALLEKASSRTTDLHSLTDRSDSLSRWVDSFRVRLKKRTETLTCQADELRTTEHEKADKDHRAADSADELGKLMRGRRLVAVGEADSASNPPVRTAAEISHQYRELTAAVEVLSEQIEGLRGQLVCDTKAATADVEQELQSMRREKDKILAELTEHGQRLKEESDRELRRVLGGLATKLYELGYLPDAQTQKEPVRPLAAEKEPEEPKEHVRNGQRSPSASRLLVGAPQLRLKPTSGRRR